MSLWMDEETRRRKAEHIDKMRQEEKPKGLLAKFKFYFKRYWYIALPVHFVGSLLWFGALYAAVYSGVDVIALLEFLHMPDSLIEKIKGVPPSAGLVVLALLLYKIATPARYATTLAGIQVAFWTLRRLGKLRTVREVEYKVRNEYTRRRFSPSMSKRNSAPGPSTKSGGKEQQL